MVQLSCLAQHGNSSSSNPNPYTNPYPNPNPILNPNLSIAELAAVSARFDALDGERRGEVATADVGLLLAGLGAGVGDGGHVGRWLYRSSSSSSGGGDGSSVSASNPNPNLTYTYTAREEAGICRVLDPDGWGSVDLATFVRWWAGP